MDNPDMLLLMIMERSLTMPIDVVSRAEEVLEGRYGTSLKEAKRR